MIRHGGGRCGVMVSRERVKPQHAVRQMHIELWVRGSGPPRNWFGSTRGEPQMASEAREAESSRGPVPEAEQDPR